MLDIFLNCDLSSQYTVENCDAIMSHVQMANIACLDASAAGTAFIRHCAASAEALSPVNVSTGAQPDIETLRRDFTPDAFVALLELQIQRYINSADLYHIKLNTPLYQLAECHEQFRDTFLDFVKSRCLISIVCPAGGQLAQAAEARNMPIIPEVFLDKAYSPSGEVMDHYLDSSEVCERALQLRDQRAFTAVDGTTFTLPEHYDHITANLSSRSNGPNNNGDFSMLITNLQAAKETLRQPRP